MNKGKAMKVDDEKKSFVLYADYAEHFEMLNYEERGMLITAIFDFVRTGNQPNFVGEIRMLFSIISKQLERDSMKWQIEKEHRSKAGKIGADARWARHNIKK